MKRAFRVLAGLMLVGGGAVIALEILLLFDLRAFEFPYLYELLGPQGIALLLALESGGLLALYAIWRVVFGAPWLGRSRRTATALLVVWAVLGAWFTEWLFLETPLTVKARTALLSNAVLDEAAQAALDYGRRHDSLPRPADARTEAHDRELGIMLSRIAINLPSVYREHPIDTTLVREGARYGVDPSFMLSFAYLGSFYGEAVSGPIPFFRALTAESFRDLVQVHVPAWFVESPIRGALVERDWLERVAGSFLGQKLRYALQKANYDASVGPFDTNVFTDVLLVMEQYPEEFPELGDPSGSLLDAQLASTFRKLTGHTLLSPCDEPYAHAPRDASYYDDHRADLIRFARTVFYKMTSDFDFATRAHTLLVKHYFDRYEQVLGTIAWSEVSPEQKMALVAMLRDVYMPNIGRPSYNLYLLPEFNCAPFSFVASELGSSAAALSDATTTWRPQHSERLWAGAAYKLRNLSEVLEATRGHPLPGINPTETTSDALTVLALNRARLE